MKKYSYVSARIVFQIAHASTVGNALYLRGPYQGYLLYGAITLKFLTVCTSIAPITFNRFPRQTGGFLCRSCVPQTLEHFLQWCPNHDVPWQRTFGCSDSYSYVSSRTVFQITHASTVGNALCLRGPYQGYLLHGARTLKFLTVCTSIAVFSRV